MIILLCVLPRTDSRRKARIFRRFAEHAEQPGRAAILTLRVIRLILQAGGKHIVNNLG